ncbi:extracellular catalytic domain type 2 short-chain-length polyhydroxyalkanoate depolymerase [Roseicella aerolata]|uniref:PHB depolymerase family esterase n=1 Tax=Roseicella aerolata TaxID=2883479 RepID=A0A9X1IGL6_9PROT|nr:PHB depolymerase family esterase [Roseicella aerolata]MCB4824451.1 PHB depolymerase family esterase [Roseicella aerolata]
MRLRTLLLALVLSLMQAGKASAADRLGRYPVDPAQVSVAGISSGAFMANQLHIAHSADIMGAGLVAGGLYGCAVLRADDSGITALASLATGACMRAPARLLPAATYAARIRRFAALGWIDPVETLGRSRLYAFTGRSDTVVHPETVRRAVAVYGLLGLPTAATSFSDGALAAGHGWVTQSYGMACGDTRPPYINDCDYDQAQQVLQTLYGPLEAAATQPSGRLIAFDQTEFAPGGDAAGHGLWHTGQLYLPAACEAAGANCRLHMLMHGCQQSAQVMGDRFYRNIGINEWADTNRIVVLYPQARSVSVADFRRPRPTDLFQVNPEGCWNWWGYAYDSRYLFKDGVQVRALWEMVQRVTGRANR